MLFFFPTKENSAHLNESCPRFCLVAEIIEEKGELNLE